MLVGYFEIGIFRIWGYFDYFCISQAGFEGFGNIPQAVGYIFGWALRQHLNITVGQVANKTFEFIAQSDPLGSKPKANPLNPTAERNEPCNVCQNKISKNQTIVKALHCNRSRSFLKSDLVKF